jgi:uncharacterized protein YukE
MRLYVNHQALNDLGNYFNKQSSEMHSLRSRMQKTINAINDAWDGPDAQAFQQNATEYIKNLSVIENNFSDYGRKMLGHEKRYNEALVDYNKKFKQPTDNGGYYNEY